MVWVDILAVHIAHGGDYFRGELVKLPTPVAEAWEEQGIVRIVPEPTARIATLPVAKPPRKPVNLQIDDGEIGHAVKM